MHESNPQLRDPGAAVRWWLEQSLDLLARSLNERNIELIVADGEALNTIEQLIEENNFDTVFWNRRYAPQEREVDAVIKSGLKDKRTARGVFCRQSAGGTLGDQIRQRRILSSFTPYAKSLRQHGGPETDHYPCQTEVSKRRPSNTRPSRKTTKEAVWSRKMSGLWMIGEAAAIDQLYHFFDTTIRDYAGDRDRPDLDGTSKLSAHLRFGEISPRQVWHATVSLMDQDHSTVPGGQKISF
ncbi:hypothetical protein HED48_22560 [Ochrobactrum intermedium]|nr:hypothetical protein [Brucella intermedia]